MQISRDDLIDILDFAHADLEHVTGETLWNKHSAVHCRVIFKNQQGELFGVDYWNDYNNGIEDEVFEIFKVKEVPSVSYEVVKDEINA